MPVAVEMTGQEQVTVIMALTVTINKPEIVAVKAVNKASMPEAAKAAMILAKAKEVKVVVAEAAAALAAKKWVHN